jgi:hypothetical protein
VPISRKYVRLVCTKDEYEVYSASLRLRLPELRMSELHTYIRRTRDLIEDAGKRAPKALVVRRIPRKGDLLSGALSRFKGRLRTLARMKAAEKNAPGGEVGTSK